METIRAIGPGLLLCALLAAPCYAAGLALPVVGGPVFGILLGMLVALAWRQRPERLARGIQFTSKKVLQYAVILLGFGLNLMQIAQVGVSSLPVILSTIATSLIVGYAGCKLLRVPGRTATLVAVGSSICGGSAIAATAPVIKARDDEVAQSISVIFLFNVIAACVTTACSAAGLDVAVFAPLKTLSKYFIVMAMLAIGLNTNLVELVRSGGKPIALGACCWVAIAAVSLLMQYALGTL